MRSLVLALLSSLLAGCSGFVGGNPAPAAIPHTSGSAALQPAPITPTAVASLRTYSITEPGCCSRPEWSPDSAQVLFIDRPCPEAEIGIYGVPVAGGAKSLVAHRIGLYSKDRSLVAFPEGGETFIERLSDQTRWRIPNESRAVHFSRDASRIAWQAGSLSIANPDRRRNEIWVSRLDGSGPRRIASIIGGRLIGWGESDEALLVSGKMKEAGPSGIWRIPLAEGGEARLLWETPSPGGMLLSPEGGWLAFYQAFAEVDRQNGLYVIRTDGSQGLRLERFGSYRWRQEGTLLLLPLSLDSSDPQLIQIDAGRAVQVQLEIPSPENFRIANNDWMPSPDGSRLVFLSSQDRSLWIVELPGG